MKTSHAIKIQQIFKHNKRYVSTNKLQEFLNQKEKNITSALYKGTLFELQTLTLLTQTTGMNLDHVGGKSDGGIDLRGKWFNDVQVIIQCKNTKHGCTPDHVRELIGTVISCSQKKKTLIGILATAYHPNRPHFTRDVLSHFNKSPLPLGLAMIDNLTLKSFMFNNKAQSILKGLTISTRYDINGNEALYINVPK
ncbi:uncharacterized protein BX663DRAFT_505985 [Cokeromyces recurvatus]|uniref:uncharacterized protein n=1 Tax=Cokeromyces recurvatus TaxID=90255 RepID=UPI00221EC3A9|nr:uncharacterized protein BX663DRAFT_505985 [Cokeromyces recurvatus]KAI7903982.1 hypothetical protein BX663DRAFT_505985 [Cokeromyces recurvatus]